MRVRLCSFGHISTSRLARHGCRWPISARNARIRLRSRQQTGTECYGTSAYDRNTTFGSTGNEQAYSTSQVTGSTFLRTEVRIVNLQVQTVVFAFSSNRMWLSVVRKQFCDRDTMQQLASVFTDALVEHFHCPSRNHHSSFLWAKFRRIWVPRQRRRSTKNSPLFDQYLTISRKRQKQMHGVWSSSGAAERNYYSGIRLMTPRQCTCACAPSSPPLTSLKAVFPANGLPP